ncbi:hypothetical protein TorRG33x02_149700 [Trema orientale]|uniref:Uncharacterized protein n=1 Tax=Trema orientale TaxID=63057 RepID=A0A2P5EUA5_TREOI|nr:hypothetical protein TorRG33x02_149700 [Trema orientale]
MGPSPSPKSITFPHFPAFSLTFPLFLTHSLCVLLLLISAALSSAATSRSPPSTIYDYLKLHGLPIGLFPKGITEFSHDPSTGCFQVLLSQPCNAKFENQVHYDFNVSGTLSFGQIGNLSGVSAQELFLWFPVKGIRVDVPSSGLIYFDVGVVDKQFSLSLFESPPDCTAAEPSDLASDDAATAFDPKPLFADDSQSPPQNKYLKLGYGVGKRSVLRATS